MNGIVATCAGEFGRFGNAMFQYAVARAYAESIGAELHVSDRWVGPQLFENMDHPIYRSGLPSCKDENLDGAENVFLHGYFQHADHIALLSRKKLKEWFKPKQKWISDANPSVAIHKRRGDYESHGNFALVSDKSYQEALEKFGHRIETAAIYSDDRSQDLIYTDFFSLMSAKVLFRANSSFSFWAGVLSDGEVYSPVVEDRTGWIDCEFVKGNHPKLVGMFSDLHIKD